MTDPQQRIAFIMGLGRSGTTFLAKLIDSSPDVLYRHEPDAILPVDMPALLHRSDLQPHLPKARDYLRAMSHCRRRRSASHVPVFTKGYRSALANLAFRPMVLSTKLAETWRLPLTASVPDLIDRGRGEVVYLIKSVSSLGRARLFADAQPDMPMVHIVRHPCAMIASLKVGIGKGVMAPDVYLRSLFAQKEAASYPYSFEAMEKASYEEQAAFRWMLMNDKAAADMAGHPRYLQIAYEDLCRQVDRVAAQVFDHIGIKIGAQTRAFIDSVSRREDPAAMGAEARRTGYFKIDRPIASALDKWRTALEPETVARIRDVVSHSPLGRHYFEAASA
ncbi:MAG: sulfotransferase [Rhizobiales bacterium]|nr:sulfotransferase [Hyphomicrobiales bacterium]